MERREKAFEERKQQIKQERSVSVVPEEKKDTNLISKLGKDIADLSSTSVLVTGSQANKLLIEQIEANPCISDEQKKFIPYAAGTPLKTKFLDSTRAGRIAAF